MPQLPRLPLGPDMQRIEGGTARYAVKARAQAHISLPLFLVDAKACDPVYKTRSESWTLPLLRRPLFRCLLCAAIDPRGKPGCAVARPLAETEEHMTSDRPEPARPADRDIETRARWTPVHRRNGSGPSWISLAALGACLCAIVAGVSLAAFPRHAGPSRADAGRSAASSGRT